LFRTSGAGQTSLGGNQTQSGCLIATAAFGSELAPQVQQLREFRDNIALKTFAGSSFMNAFNAWYYSFSPSVAEYERSSSWAREAVRGAIQPLLMILDASKSLHSTLSFLGMNSESAVIVTGLMASSIIGLFYLSPVAVFIGIKKKQFLDIRRVKIILMTCWVVSGILLAVGAISMSSEPMTVGTSMLVLCSMSTAALFLSDRISRL
jgi:peptide/nickel transport system substrate-binding protein